MFPGERDNWLPGVLSKNQMESLMGSYIDGVENFDDAADYSSIDLYLSNEGYKMLHGSLKPTGDKPYIDLLQDRRIAEKLTSDSKGIFSLEPETCYVFKLKESLNINMSKTNIYGQATAKSSIGRLDVIARLIVCGMSRYEYFNPRKLNKGSGKLFLEIIPISFKIRVKEGVSLTQLRLFYGRPEESIVREQSFIKNILHNSSDGEGYLSVDVTNRKQSGLDVAAFCASRVNNDMAYIDLWRKNGDGRPNPIDHWTFKVADDQNRLELENGNFYILRSKERITLPAGIAVYAKAMDETLGEMRIHYAGFVHPFFGMDREDDEVGTPLIFEVRAHNVNVTLVDGERLAKLIFYRMSEDADLGISEDKRQVAEKRKYNDQELKLSGHFGEWPASLNMDDNGNLINREGI